MKSEQLPLAGVRVLDFGHVWAGPYCAASLGDLGAEVIKVESSRRLDVHRRQGPYAGGVPGPDRSGVWNAQNRGKRSVTLNLKSGEGCALAKRLVEISDVVIENFSPGVMARLGLAYEDLVQVRPDVIAISLSAFGQCGPQWNYVGYGPSLDGWAGLDSFVSYSGSAPGSLGGVFPDTGSALYGVVGVIAALIHRQRTGMGCYLDLSELEASALLIHDAVLDDLALGEDGVQKDAPSGSDYFALRCKDGNWIFVDRDEARLEVALGIGPASSGSMSRTARLEDELRRLVTRSGSDECVELCLDAGIAAAAVNDIASLLEDPQVRARGVFSQLPHPFTATAPVYGSIWRLSEAPIDVGEPAPLLGEGNEYVLMELLNISADELDGLRERGIVA